MRDLIISEATDWQVLTLHLAVHMQQLRSAIASGASDAAQLARDALEIHAPLAHRLGVHHLSGGLEDLAFKALYPEQYHEIRQATEARMPVYQEAMETAKRAVYAALHQDTEFISQVNRSDFTQASTYILGNDTWFSNAGRMPDPSLKVTNLSRNPMHEEWRGKLRVQLTFQA